MPVIDRLPVPEPLRQVPPWAARPGPEENPVDHRPVSCPPATLPRISGEQRPQPLPLLIGQIMTIQSIQHHTGLYDLATKIHGTRPSRPRVRGARPARAAAADAGRCVRL